MTGKAEGRDATRRDATPPFLQNVRGTRRLESLTKGASDQGWGSSFSKGTKFLF